MTAAASAPESIAASVADLTEALAQRDLALDALQALLRGGVIEKVKYGKVIDDLSCMTAEQQRALRFATAVLAEAGR